MKLRLVKTCNACPEQYDVYIGTEYVAYLRLRHGYFRAECPPDGQIVYKAETEGDGMFMEHERDRHLNAACMAILMQLNAEKQERLYEIEDGGP